MSTPQTDKYGNRYWYNSQGQLHRKDGPACEYSNGTRAWWVNGMLHRTDSPAVEQANGTREWWLNGRRHRVDGPAIVWDDGDREWYLNGLYLTFEQWLDKAATPQHQSLLRLRWA
jgi:hypothetical protein